MEAVAQEQFSLNQNPIRIINQDMHPEDIAYCSRGMPDHWFIALRAMHANDVSNLKKLNIKLTFVALNIKHRHKWKMPVGQDMLRRMVDLAIVELIDARRFREKDAWRVRVAFMGVDDSNWYRTWRKRYEVIYSELNDWANRGYRWMKCSPERIANSKTVVKRREREQYLRDYGRENEIE